jgi:hypothetical protein
MQQKLLNEIDPPTESAQTPFARMLSRARSDSGAA